MSDLSVPEAARRLGVSEVRVRQRIKDGSLAAERVGGRWVVKASSLSRASGRLHSRPLSQRMSWAVLSVLAGSAPQVSAQERSRAYAYARRLLSAEDPAPLMRAWFSARAERNHYRAAEADVPDLLDDERLVKSGVSAPRSGIVAQGIAEGYVRPDDLDDIIDEYFLLPAHSEAANVVLHVADVDPKQALAGLGPLVAADLAEHGGPREWSRVRELVEGMEVRQ
jgi:excisionase family DNA binding protein